MKINFSELLASERIRPLWGRSFTQETALDDLQRILGQNSPVSGPTGVPNQQDPRPDFGDREAKGGSASGARSAGDGAGQTHSPAGDRAADASDLGRGPAHPAATSATASGGVESTGSSALPTSDGAAAFVPPTDLSDLPIRPPHEIFAELELAVRNDLGSRATMVRNFIEALRVRVHGVDPTADEALYHPMRHAAGGSIWELLTRMEDTLSGLRRVAAGR